MNDSQLEREYQDKRNKVLNYSLFSFGTALVYQYVSIKKGFPNISSYMRVGVSFSTGVLSYGISYLVLRNLYEI